MIIFSSGAYPFSVPVKGFAAKRWKPLLLGGFLSFNLSEENALAVKRELVSHSYVHGA